MTEEESKIAQEAFTWIKDHSKFIINSFIPPDDFDQTSKVLSLFMAGSPGAGKTEVSKRLTKRFNKKPVIIDADEIRKLCPGYTGSNAHVFQKAATKGVHILYDYVLAKNIDAILDGTFSYADAIKNIERSLKYGRKVEICFVYQNPVHAWEFTKKREMLERRRVLKETFIKSFFQSQENVSKAKEMFGDSVQLNMVIKDNNNEIERFELNINKIDDFINKKYTQDELHKILV